MYSTPRNNHRPSSSMFNDYQFSGIKPLQVPPSSSERNLTNNNISQFHYANQSPQKQQDYGLFSKRYLNPKSQVTSRVTNSPNFFNRSRVSHNQNSSIGGGVLNSDSLFSEEMVFLLSEEESNIQYFKEKIDLERANIERDFENMKQKCIHSIEDLKISFQAELHKSYKEFIQKYQEFKGRMQELKDIRKIILSENGSEQPPSEYLHQLNTTKNANLSNRDILLEIEKDAKLFRNQRLFQEISETQKFKLEPAKAVTEELIVLGGIDKEYYKQNESRELIKRLQSVFERELKEVYGDILDTYVFSAQKMIEMHFESKEANNMVLNGLNDERTFHTAVGGNIIHQERNGNTSSSRQNYRSLDNRDLNRSNATYVNKIRMEEVDISEPYGLTTPKGNNAQQNFGHSRRVVQERAASHDVDYLSVREKSQSHNPKNLTRKYQQRKISQHQNWSRDRPISDWKSSRHERNDNNIMADQSHSHSQWSRNYHMTPTNQNQSHEYGASGKKTVNFSKKLKATISDCQQNYATDWLQDLKLKQVGQIEAYQHQDAILTCVFAGLNGQFLCTGGKDKQMRVYRVSDGKLMATLQGHKASICSMATHMYEHSEGLSFVSSGGDHGCSSLILWDVRTWTIHSKITSHTAAVTSIVDLQDGEHLLTASYDKKINLINFKSSTLIFDLKQNTAAVACMALTADGNRVISSGLDSSLTIWKIFRNGKRIDSIDLESQFSLSQLVCSLRALSLRNNFCVVGSKDGKIQLINVLTGETIKKLAVSGGSIIEVLLFERESKPEWPLVLSCSAKEKSMVLTRTDTGVNSFIDTKGKLNVDFGCGIGPKVVLEQNGHMAILSQSNHSREIAIYKLQIR